MSRMSSTNINVGILDGRNSSRVLKPPGGGYSQIFGKYENERPKQIKHQNTSEIKDCFMHQETKTEITQETVTMKEELETVNDGNNVVNKVEAATEPAAKDDVPVNDGPVAINDVGLDIKEVAAAGLKEGNDEKLENNEMNLKKTQRTRVPPGGYSSGFW